MIRRGFCFALILGFAGAACRSSNPPGPTLTVALAPGRIEDFQRVLAPQFEQMTGAHVNVVGLRSADQVARLRIEKGHPTLDVLWIDDTEAQLLAREGLLTTLTERDIPNLGHVRANARSSRGIAPIAFSSALGFLVNTQIVQTPPHSWADLWNPRYRGQIALFDFGSTIGPMTLVMAARLAGGGASDVEPGFRKLAAIKPNVFGFRTSGPENNNLVAQGEAGITLALANQTRDLQAKGAPVQWIVPAEGALALPQSFQIVAGSASPELARVFVNYALGQEAQTRLADELLLVVTNKDVTVAPEVAPLVPLDNIIYLDFDAIGAHRGEWTNRFNREILGG